MFAENHTKIEVIIPNLNKRFSGITATVAAVIPHQYKEFKIASCGTQLPINGTHLSWGQLLKLTKHPLPNNKPRIFHARRNNEMLMGLVLKKIFRRHLHLIFTSTAQRSHSGWTRFLYQNMDTLLSTSQKAASFLVRKPDKIIPHGVDTRVYHPSDNRTQTWAETGLPGKYGIGIFGRVRPQKGLYEFVHSLCEVLPNHPDFTAVIIGETTPKFESFVHDLKAHIASKNLSDRFVWLGKLPFAEIPLWFQRMSLTACLSHNEGFGLTCLEAMASGCPVIATQAGAFEMIIREGTDGRIVPCKDINALKIALENLISDPEHLQQLGTNARERILQSFQIENEAKAINAVYREILG